MSPASPVIESGEGTVDLGSQDEIFIESDNRYYVSQYPDPKPNL